MPADSVANDITNRMERWVGQASGTKRQESRSIVGASIVSNYFQDNVDPNGALTQVNSLALASIPNLPPGHAAPGGPPVRPDEHHAGLPAGRRQRRPGEQRVGPLRRRVGTRSATSIMAIPGANAPVVYGGKVRAVMLYIDRSKMQARRLSPLDVMKAMDNYNVFLPTGDAKLGRHRLRHRQQLDVPRHRAHGRHPARPTPKGNAAYLRDVASPEDSGFIQTNIVRVNGRREVYIPIFRQLGASTLRVVDTVIGVGQGLRGAGLAAEHRPQGRDGPVDLRPPVDQGAGPGRGDGGLLLRPGDPAVPRPVEDDGDRRDDAARSRSWSRSPACTPPGTRST